MQPTKLKLTSTERRASVMLALLFATVAFSIDAMLPALPQIAAVLTPDDPGMAAGITSFRLHGRTSRQDNDRIVEALLTRVEAATRDQSAGPLLPPNVR